MKEALDPLDEAEDDKELFKNEIIMEFGKKIFNNSNNISPLIRCAP